MNEYRHIESCCSKGEIDECPICMENFELGVKTILTDCGHKLCIKCFIILNLNSNKCPICRQQMNIQVPRGHVHHHNHTNYFQRIYNYWFTRREDETPSPLRRGIVLNSYSHINPNDIDSRQRNRSYPNIRRIVPI